MNIAIVGARTLEPWMIKQLEALFNELENDQTVTVVTGCANGVDQFAREESAKRGIKFIEFKANWNLGRAAGPMRNTDIINAANVVHAFPGKSSKGTFDSINKAIKKGLKVFVHKEEVD